MTHIQETRNVLTDAGRWGINFMLRRGTGGGRGGGEGDGGINPEADSMKSILKLTI